MRPPEQIRSAIVGRTGGVACDIAALTEGNSAAAFLRHAGYRVSVLPLWRPIGGNNERFGPILVKPLGKGVQ
jgi:hypothetical protein